MQKTLLTICGYLLLSQTSFANIENTVVEKDIPTHEKKQRTAHFTDKSFSHLNVSVGVSTLGINIEAATPLTKNLKLRGGLNFFNLNSSKYDIDIDDENGTLYEAFGISPTYEMKAQFNTFHAHALVDYYPFKKGIFHLTGGFYIGNTKIKANGFLTDGNGTAVTIKPGYDWPTLEFDGKELDITNGELNAELTLGNTIKPYLGVGLGRAVSKRKFGVKFELGVLYQGEYTLKQNNKKVASTSDISASIEDADKYTKWMSWWPMVNLQLNYRIF